MALSDRGGLLFWIRLTAVLSLCALILLGGLVGYRLFELGVFGREEPVVIADVASERLTRSGSVLGFAARNETHAWLGVPYAQAPVATLRWRAPRAAEPWTDTRDALAWSPPCPQVASAFGLAGNARIGDVVGEEDCLYLNIWAPRFDPEEVPAGGERLPVLVWIHGGGNTTGRAGPMYDGARLAGRHGAIVVTVGYRLGPLGWFAHAGLHEAGFSRAEQSGNFALLDLVEALGWLRDNIAYFGGDPGNITLFGESAGATNVVALMLSQTARGLFHGAIAQSPDMATTSVAQASHYRDDSDPGDPFSAPEVVLEALVQDGSAVDRAAARARVEALAPGALGALLRDKSVLEIFSAYGAGDGRPRIRLPRLVRDGHVLPLAEPVDALADPGPASGVPLIIGSNRDEQKLYQALDPELVRRTLGAFMRIRDEQRYERLARHRSDLYKLRGVDAAAGALVRAGRSDVYVYRFDWDEEPVVLGGDFGAILGAAHGMEIPFVFGSFRLPSVFLSRLFFTPDNSVGRRVVSDAMMSYWAEHARSGSPGRGRDGNLPQWRSWARNGTDRPQMLVFDAPGDGGIHMSAGELTGESVVRAVLRDGELALADRCAIAHEAMREVGGAGDDLRARVAESDCPSRD